MSSAALEKSREVLERNGYSSLFSCVFTALHAVWAVTLLTLLLFLVCSEFLAATFRLQ